MLFGLSLCLLRYVVYGSRKDTGEAVSVLLAVGFKGEILGSIIIT